MQHADIKQHLSLLKRHLKQENPVLEKVMQGFSDLDRIGRRLGYLRKDQSFATRTPWWPLIAVLGTYSSGKSTFINSFLGHQLQATGTQAVDDKFTVICYSGDNQVHVLPGKALDADPRFPLYRIGWAIEDAAPGEGQHVDAFLQLKTCPSQMLRGKIFIDSPGFDADAKRTSTLRITDRIIDLSDLVLVFFDARHPESGSMRDTLQHLVKSTVKRKDATKFLYILNQMDVTAQEDNPEQVFAAWQRALAQQGLTAGQYFSIYNPDVAVHIGDEEVRRRFEKKRQANMAEISRRIEHVTVERAYRIVGLLEESANRLSLEVLPAARRFLAIWRRRVLALDGLALAGLFLALLGGGLLISSNGSASPFVLFSILVPGPTWHNLALGLVLPAAVAVHFLFRSWSARTAAAKLQDGSDPATAEQYRNVYRINSRWWRSIFRRQPAGWNTRQASNLESFQEQCNRFIQELNDAYTDPSGRKQASASSQGSETAAGEQTGPAQQV